MNYKNDFDLDRIKSVPIHEVAALLDNIQRQGSHYVTLCPWHNDTHPSLVLFEKTNENRCHCFACGKSGGVIDYVKAKLQLPDNKEGFKGACQWICANFNIPFLDGRKAKSDIKTIQAPTPIKEDSPIAYIPMDYVRQTVSVSNSLSVCIEQLFGRETAERVTHDYKLGTLRNQFHQDATIFWSIDENGLVHNGKIQRYDIDISSPHFAHAMSFKTPDGREMKSYWMTKQLTREGFVPQGSRLDVGGLFGAHLLNSSTIERAVILVESPKNAIFGSAAYPEYLWVAAGNKSALNAATLKCLEGRHGKIYPDRDAIEDWRRQKRTLRALARFEISDFCEKNAPANSPKYDIADYIVDYQLKLRGITTASPSDEEPSEESISDIMT